MQSAQAVESILFADASSHTFTDVSPSTVLSLQARDTNSTLFVTYPWPLASLKTETPAAPPIKYHESRNLC